MIDARQFRQKLRLLENYRLLPQSTTNTTFTYSVLLLMQCVFHNVSFVPHKNIKETDYAL